jgi:uncharacterized protein YycO
MKRVLIPILIFSFFFTLFTGCEKEIDQNVLKDGDIVFQESISRQSAAIQLATKSRYSHMGMIFKQGDEFLVLEAVQPVQFTPLDEWIKRGKRSHIVVKRVKNKEIDSEEIHKMKQQGEGYVGKKYDIHFEWSDEKIYCSELVWKIYKDVIGIEIGPLKKLKDFDLTHERVKSIMKKRYGDNIPYEETVISPGDIFDSDKLTTVLDN